MKHMSGENPRFHHTFADEDQMRVLKGWAKRSHGKNRQRGVMQLARARYKTLRWRIKDVVLKKQ